MYSSPAIRLYTSENVDNLVQRKPVNNVLSRKPFNDRPVNSTTPDTAKLLKPKLNLKKDVAIEKPKSPKTNLNAEEFSFSYKEVEDSYEDIWPISSGLSKERIIKILRNYCNLTDTPPPSPDLKEFQIDPIFLDIPEPEMLEQAYMNEWNDSYDVEVPDLDFDDLDMSI